MKRRAFLGGAGSVLLLAGGIAWSWTTRQVSDAARTALRIPSDLLARIRRRTKPLDPEALDGPHDLAG